MTKSFKLIQNLFDVLFGLLNPHLIVMCICKVLDYPSLQALSLVHASYDEFLSCDRGDNGRASRAFELHNALNLAGCDMAAHTYCNLKVSRQTQEIIFE